MHKLSLNIEKQRILFKKQQNKTQIFIKFMQNYICLFDYLFISS